MICPACKGLVVVAEYQRIELDYCTQCGGVWFDVDELELLAERLSLGGNTLAMEDILALPEKRVSEKRRRCPICRRRMKKVVVGSDPGVLVDVCPVGDGTWFDGGEVAQVLSQLRDRSPLSGDHGRVINFLGEVFEART